MTTSFHKLPFQERYAILGDPAEKVFEAVSPLGTFDRFGWHRPRSSMSKMAPMLRNLPDYYAQSGHLVEVIGCGRDGLLKLKSHKLATLKAWNELQPVMMFFWNSHKGQWTLVELEEVERLYHQVKDTDGLKQFHDGPTYAAIPWDSMIEVATKTGSYNPSQN